MHEQYSYSRTDTISYPYLRYDADTYLYPNGIYPVEK